MDGTKSATYPDDADVIAGLIDNAIRDGADLSEGLMTSKQQIAVLTSERDEALRQGLVLADILRPQMNTVQTLNAIEYFDKRRGGSRGGFGPALRR